MTHALAKTLTATQSAGSPRWASVSRELSARGLDEAELVRAVLAALRSSADEPPAVDPAGRFTPEDARLLRTGGLTLEARTDREPDVRLETMARLATTFLDAMDTATVARDLGVSTARIRQRAAARSLYAVREGAEWRFPRWQFEASGAAIPGVAEVVAALPAGLHPVAVERFFTEPCPDLEIDDTPVPPVLWLRAGGDPRTVATIAGTL